MRTWHAAKEWPGLKECRQQPGFKFTSRRMPWYTISFLSLLKLYICSLIDFQFKPPALQESDISVASEMETPICGEINPQPACPLFNRIPNELRNHIFQLALTSFDDKTRPYKKGAYYYRPGHRYAQKIDTTLLLTCRRIFLETESVPASINEHTSWYERPPADLANNELSMESHPAAFKRRLRLKTLHLFTQQYWLEGQNQRGAWRFGFQTLTQNWNSMFASVTCLRITLRHSDWWYV